MSVSTPRDARIGLACRHGSWGRQKIEGWAFLVCVVSGWIVLPHEEGETPEDLIRMLGWEESGMMRQGVKSEVL